MAEPYWLSIVPLVPRLHPICSEGHVPALFFSTKTDLTFGQSNSRSAELMRASF
ncbi:MAG: hypothetical protein IKI83_03380 [Prevotella sp.]|nr:hypothetical protein [Prevotella sp.]